MKNYSLTWHSDQPPRIHEISLDQSPAMEFQGQLFDFTSRIYPIARYYFGPYKIEAIANRSENPAIDQSPHLYPDFLLGGECYTEKLFAYANIGTAQLPVVNWLHDQYRAYVIDDEMSMHPADTRKYGMARCEPQEDAVLEHSFLRNFFQYWHGDRPTKWGNDADALACLHSFLVQMVTRKIVYFVPKNAHLICYGNAFCNRKLNSELRDIFENIEVSVFPRGASVYSGPWLPTAFDPPDGWPLVAQFRKGEWKPDKPNLANLFESHWLLTPMPIEFVAELLACKPDEPVIVMHGRAEIGPNALGHRSIFMSARKHAYRDTLNRMKGREHWRPVPAICMEEFASSYFSLGTPDPYMNFEHLARHAAAFTTPAIVQANGSVQLQTIGETDCPDTYTLVKEYFKLTGIPILCNEPACEPDERFFANMQEAMGWADIVGIKSIWHEGILLTWQPDKRQGP
jgi:carbamoyltransferase